MAEEFRQYFQAITSTMDNFFVSSTTKVSHTIKETKVNAGVAKGSVRVSVDNETKTELRTNFTEWWNPDNNSNPSSKLLKSEVSNTTNTVTTVEGKGPVRGADLNVKNETKIGPNGLTNKTEAMIGKGNTGVYIGGEPSGTIEAGVKTSRSESVGSTKTTQTFKAGVSTKKRS